jgi:hypothetical protein
VEVEKKNSESSTCDKKNFYLPTPQKRTDRKIETSYFLDVLNRIFVFWYLLSFSFTVPQPNYASGLFFF